jgi:hypothetical protein
MQSWGLVRHEEDGAGVATMGAAEVYSPWSGNKNEGSGQRTRVPRDCGKPSYASSIRRERCNREKAMICWCELVVARVFSGYAESQGDCNHLSRESRSRLAWHVRVAHFVPGQRTLVPHGCGEPSYVSSIRRGRCDLEKAMICWCELLLHARVFSGYAESQGDCNHLGRESRSRQRGTCVWHTSSRIVSRVVGPYTAASPRWCALVVQSDQTCFHADPSTPRGPLPMSFGD